MSLADGPAVLPPGAQPLPAAAKKRRRVSIRPRSCFTLEELPPGPGAQHVTRLKRMPRMWSSICPLNPKSAHVAGRRLRQGRLSACML